MPSLNQNEVPNQNCGAKNLGLKNFLPPGKREIRDIQLLNTQDLSGRPNGHTVSSMMRRLSDTEWVRNFQMLWTLKFFELQSLNQSITLL